MTDETETDAKSNASWTCQRGEGGKFVSTTGRPVGSRNKASQASVKAITSLGDLAFQQLRALLQAGHPETVRFVISNLIPAGGRAVTLDDISAEGLLDAVSSGAISPAEMRQLATAISKIKEIESIDKIQDRLAELERVLRNESI